MSLRQQIHFQPSRPDGDFQEEDKLLSDYERRFQLTKARWIYQTESQLNNQTQSKKSYSHKINQTESQLKNETQSKTFYGNKPTQQQIYSSNTAESEETNTLQLSPRSKCKNSTGKCSCGTCSICKAGNLTLTNKLFQGVRSSMFGVGACVVATGVGLYAVKKWL